MTRLNSGFFQIAISLLPYVAIFSGQLYFQSNYSTQQLLFGAAVSSEHLLYLTSSFFRIVNSSQLLFFQKQLLFQSETSTEQPPFQNRKFFRVLNFWNSYLFGDGIVQNKDIYRETTFRKKANFSGRQYSVLPTFSGELPFQSGYFFKRIIFYSSYIFKRAIFYNMIVKNFFPQLNFVFVRQ